MRLTDRSRIITYQTCPRKRYLQYEYQGRGIESAYLSKDLFTGICVHRGLEYLLKGVGGSYTPNALPFLVDDSVSDALTFYYQECQSHNFANCNEDERSFLYLELRALIEALIRVYAKVQLPKLLSEFEVLEVEREYEYELVPSTKVQHNCEDKKHCVYNNVSNEDGITLMARPDALLRERSTGNLYIMSFKTASSYDSRTDEQNRYDMQGISEVVAVEEDLADTWRDDPWLGGLYKEQQLQPPKISGVKMEYLIKGSFLTLESDNGPVERGQKYTNNNLIHPYYSESIANSFPCDALSYFWKWQDREGNNRTLGKGWKRVNIWELKDVTIKDWVDMLAEDEREPLEKVIATPEIYFRHEGEIKDWLEQTIAQEIAIAGDVEGVINAGQEFYRKALNQCFPQYRHSCFNYNSPCSFINICWKGDMPNDPEYQPRNPNHQLEREVFNV